MRNGFPRRLSSAPLHAFSKLYAVPLVLHSPSSFEAMSCFVSGRRKVAVVRHRMICFVPTCNMASVNKLLDQGYVKERLKLSFRKFYGRYGDVIKQYEVFLSQMLNDILWPDHIQWQPPTDQTLYRTRPFTEFWVVSIDHLRRVWHADRERLLLRTPGLVHWGLSDVLLVETNPFPNLSLFFRTMLFEYPSVPSRFCLMQILTGLFNGSPIHSTSLEMSSFLVPWQPNLK